MFERTLLPEVFLYTPKRFEDARGFFVETYRRAAIEAMTGPLDWVQDNHSRSVDPGVVRGLHFQIPPFAQDKLIRCVRGAILDVAVDIRVGSPNFGRWDAAVLSEDNGRQIFIPKGFAHGFAALEAPAEVIYKVSNYYNRDAERGVRFDDPDIGIDWRVAPERVILSDKDAVLPRLSELPTFFRYP